MIKSKEHIDYLWNQLLEDTSTPAELEELIDYLKNHPNDPYINEIIAAQMAKRQSADRMDEVFLSESLKRILQTAHLSESSGDLNVMVEEDPILPYSLKDPDNKVHFMRNTWFRVAAVLLLLIGGSFYVWNSGSEQSETAIAETPKKSATDINPGSNKATLTLSDGSIIELDSSLKGTIAQQGGTIISKSTDGMLAYDGGSAEAPLLFNKVTTPIGGQYQLVLPDGTKVWLNAGSSISYPTYFSTKERAVSITGEVYFEVVKNAAMPFKVKTITDLILVLGTSFNVNSYQDERGVKTSLIEGSVKIGKKVLQSGQAHLNGAIFKTRTEQDIAWKNGVFNFDNIDLDIAMRQLARWYDIEIVYKNGLPFKSINGEMGRNLNLSEAINVLNEIGIPCELKNRQLIVSQ